MYGVKANIKAHHRFMRMGACVWIVDPRHGPLFGQVMVRGLSRGGRTVTTWLDAAKYLTNFRPAFLVDSHHAWSCDREDAARWCALMNDFVKAEEQ